MSWTTAELTALESAISSGALEVRFADRMVTYRSMDDMLKLRSLMRRSLGLDATDRTHFAKFRKGPRPGFYPGAGRSRTGME
jgi:hypothetical protein